MSYLLKRLVSVSDTREWALKKAEEALLRISSGLGGRYYKTQKQINAKVAQILTGLTSGSIEDRSKNRHQSRQPLHQLASR